MQKSKRMEEGFAAVCLILGVCVVVGFSMWQGQYNLDPHHWGLQLSNAVDLADGKMPYREIFAQYGILTVVFNYLFFNLFGGSNLSIMLGTSLLYGAGLVGVYFLTLAVFRDRRIAFCAFISGILTHPLAIYPWSNYMAYPFITFGLYFLVRGEHDRFRSFLGGVLLGLAVLTRENLFFALAPVVVLQFPIRWLSGSKRPDVLAALSAFVGALLPLFAFAAFIWANDLGAYWSAIAFDLPALYKSQYMPDGAWAAIWRLLKYVASSIIALILIAGVFAWVLALFRVQRLRDCWTPGILTMALAAGLLMSSSLGLNEVFRLATSTMLGIGLIYGLALRAGGELTFKITAVVGLILSALPMQVGNYFYPSEEQREISVTSSDLAVFRGHRWRREAFDYYTWFYDTMATLDARDCGLKYFRNQTFDAFFAVLAPFDQYQLGPMGRGLNDIDAEAWALQLRPDLTLPERLEARDIVVIKDDFEDAMAVPDGYVLFDRRATPRSKFNLWETDTLILTPKVCATGLGAPKTQL